MSFRIHRGLRGGNRPLHVAKHDRSLIAFDEAQKGGMMASPVATVVLDADGVLTTTTDLKAAAPLIQNFLAQSKAGFSLPAVLVFIEWAAAQLPVGIADFTAIFASAPGPVVKP